MAMGKLTTQEQTKLLNFISDLGMTPQDALIFFSRYELSMGEHQDLRSSLGELEKVKACLSGQSQANGFNLIKCKDELLNMLALVELRQHQWEEHCKNIEKLRADVIKEDLAEIRDTVLRRMHHQVTEDSQQDDDSQVFGCSQQDDDSQVFGCSEQDDDSQVFGCSEQDDDSQVFGCSQQDDDSQVFGCSQQDDEAASDPPSSDAEPKSKKAKTEDA